ncbi:MAG: hypothetical protein AB8F95_16750 [Bacteroidia bacterium]
MDTRYTPVACNLVDELEAAMVTNQSGEIIFEDESGNTHTYTGKAKTWETRSDKAEYLILPDGTAIRLDRIISFFGKPFTGRAC